MKRYLVGLGAFLGLLSLLVAYELYAVTHPDQAATISVLVWGIEDAYPPATPLIAAGLVVTAWCLLWHFVTRGQATGWRDWSVTWNKDAPHKG